MFMDKLSIGLLAEIMYIKEIICYEEYNAMMEITTPSDADVFIDRLLRGDFNVYKRGELRES